MISFRTVSLSSANPSSHRTFRHKAASLRPPFRTRRRAQPVFHRQTEYSDAQGDTPHAKCRPRTTVSGCTRASAERSPSRRHPPTQDARPADNSAAVPVHVLRDHLEILPVMPDERILDMKLRVILKQRMVYKPIKPRRLIRRKPVAPRDAYPHPIRAVRSIIHKHAPVRADARRRIRNHRPVPSVRIRQKDRLVKTPPLPVRRTQDSDAYPYRRIALIDCGGSHRAAQRVPVRQSRR